MARQGRKRLSVDIPIKLHEQIMGMAKKYNIKLTSYIIRILIEKLSWEKQFE